ncbi:MAG: GNAT family N-acetyltransferase [Chthoniobacteraceae bacterium]
MIASKPSEAFKRITKETLVKGRPTQVECFEIAGQTYAVSRGPLTMLSLEEEWYDDVRDPSAMIETLKNSDGFKPDIFTFWQRLPDLEPRHSFQSEWEEIAVLPIQSYEHWFNKQIKSRTRGLIRKAEKEGIVVRETAYDDSFVRGMTAIFNETPVRQGRKFWHYGKNFETVKAQFSRYIHREYMIGAYLDDKLIGFIMMANTGKFALIGQIISAVEHREKGTNNALIAKAVEVCAQRKLPYLCYLFWSGDSLAEFKRRCGFEKMCVPRYFVPLTPKGKLALKFGVHRGWRELIPSGLKSSLKKLRSRWYGMSGAE